MRKIMFSNYFNGKNAVVTASTSGLGFVTAKSLINNGANVVICSRSREKLKKVKSELGNNAKDFVCDLSNADSVNEFIRNVKSIFSEIHYFVYIPGDPMPGKFFNIEIDDWYKATDILLISAVRMVKEFSSMMTRNSSIVISTSVAIKEPLPDLALSNVVRLSLAGLVKTVSNELAPNGIRVNGILPGYFLTPGLKKFMKLRNINLKEISKLIPMMRVGDPEEFANLVLFLLSPLSSYITGTMITIDGGLLRSVF
jgi:3-oxoacyl-[acyl-carrier protein] reductase